MYGIFKRELYIRSDGVPGLAEGCRRVHAYRRERTGAEIAQGSESKHSLVLAQSYTNRQFVVSFDFSKCYAYVHSLRIFEKRRDIDNARNIFEM